MVTDLACAVLVLEAVRLLLGKEEEEEGEEEDKYSQFLGVRNCCNTAHFIVPHPKGILTLDNMA